NAEEDLGSRLGSRHFLRFTFHVLRITHHASRFTLHISPLSFSHVNILQLSVTFHCRHAEIAAEAALFEAAEGRFDVEGGVAVESQAAAPDGAGPARGAAQAFLPNRTAQAIAGFVPPAHHPRLVVDRRDATARAEALLLPHPVARLDAQQHRRLE